MPQPTRRKRKENRTENRTNVPVAVAVPVEDPMEEIQSDTEVEEVQMSGTMAKFKLDLFQLKGENKLLKEEIRLLKEEARLLKQERDHLKEKAPVTAAPPSLPTTSKGARKKRPEDSDIGASSDSDDDLFEKRKGKKRKRKHSSSEDYSSDDRRTKRSRGKSTSFGKKALNPQDVVHRYKKCVKMYKKNRSVSTTCELLNVDRGTIAGTAVIADVLIAGQGGKFGELPAIGKKQSLAEFALLCKGFLDGNQPLQAKIEEMREATDLLPITYKLPKPK